MSGSSDHAWFIYQNATSLGASFNGAPINLKYMKGMSLPCIVTGTATGSIKLQSSNDIASDEQGTGIVNWIDIAGTSTALAGAAINVKYNLTDNYDAWVRLVYTRTGSSGNITAVCMAKSG